MKFVDHHSRRSRHRAPPRASFLHSSGSRDRRPTCLTRVPYDPARPRKRAAEPQRGKAARSIATLCVFSYHRPLENRPYCSPLAARVSREDGASSTLRAFRPPPSPPPLLVLPPPPSLLLLLVLPMRPHYCAGGAQRVNAR